MVTFAIRQYNDNGEYTVFKGLDDLLLAGPVGRRSIEILFDLLIEKNIVTIDECNDALSSRLPTDAFRQ